MIDANVFDDVDAAMMAHPSPLNEHRYHSLAIERYFAPPIYFILHVSFLTDYLRPGQYFLSYFG